MRFIPKSTKIKLQFYKGIGICDVIIGLICLGFIVLILVSSLENKYLFAVMVGIVSVTLFIPIGDEKFYNCFIYSLKFLLSKKKFVKQNVSTIMPYKSIQDEIVTLKAGGFFGVIEVKPINFYILDEYKQNNLIDYVFNNILKSCTLGQEMQILKLEKPLILDKYISNDLKKIQNLISANENGTLQDKEFTTRVGIVEDRINSIDFINSSQEMCKSSYYFIVQDISKQSLIETLVRISDSLKSYGIQNDVLSNKNLTVFLRYTIDKNFEESVILNLEKDNNVKSLKPKRVIFKSNKVIQDNLQLSNFVITDYPINVANAWAEELFDMENTKVIFKMKPVEKDKAIKRLDNTISELSSQNVRRKASVVLDRETHIQTLQQLLVQLQTDNEAFFDVSVYITVYDALNSTTNKKKIKRKLRELGVKFNEMFGRQQEAYCSSMINKTDLANKSRGMPSSTISASFPFVSNAVFDEKGIIIGENKFPVFLDLFKRDNERINSNAVIIGKSGSGKSFATKTILAQLACEDAKIFILDPENEYTTLTENIGGKILDVASSANGIINPFHIIDSIEDKDNTYYAHLQFLEEFYRVILPDISADCLELLNKMTVKLYDIKNINNKTKIDELKPSDYPIFEDLSNLIEKELLLSKDEYTKSCFKILSNYLSKFRTGGRNSNLWNGYTSLYPKENFVCFNFQKLLASKNKVIANAQMLLILKWIENEIMNNRVYNEICKSDRKIIVVIDEAHVFIDEKFPIALDFMYNLAKRIRKYNGMQIVITQNIKDFVGSPEIAKKSSAIINVSQYSFIFALSPNDINDLCLLYEKSGTLNDNEIENIVNLGCGNAFLIISQNNRTNVEIVASPPIQSLFEEKNNCT